MKPSRNDPCPCGSGKKFKLCCERKSIQLPAIAMAMPTIAEINQLLGRFNEGYFIEVEKRTRVWTEQFPALVPAWKLLGICLHRQGKLSEALPVLVRATELAANDAEAHYNLGVTQEGLGQLNEAAASYLNATTFNPNSAAAYNNLGNVFRELRRFNEAVINFRIALKIKPDYAGAHLNLSDALREVGQFNEAIVSCRSALSINTNFAEAYNGIGNVLKDLKQYKAAIANYQRALLLQPNLAKAHNNLALIFEELGQYSDVVTSCRRLLEINSKAPDVHARLGTALCELGDVSNALSSCRQALEIKPDYFIAHSNLLMASHYTNFDPSFYIQESMRFGASVAQKVTARFENWQCEPRPQRLRVAFVSGDLRAHSVGHFIESLLAQLNPANIELIAYPTQAHEDELTARIKPHFAKWKPLVGMNDQAAAQLIHADGVNVLVDLSGHTAHNRLPLFAWKPAPVQITWLGLPATTGVVEMDYILGDPIAIPPEDAGHFSERIWCLPEIYLCLSAPDTALEVSPLPAISHGFVTFASFNNLAKMNDTTVTVWARILTAIPNARLLLKAKQLTDPTVFATTLQRFAAQGIDAERIILAQPTALRSDHLASYHQVDIGLDPFPYPGITTSAEALWMGVPVLTMRGDRFMSRTAASIAHNSGLPDWIAMSEDEYVEKAVHFASDLPKLATLRAGLRKQVSTSPLFDAPRFAKHFEEALWSMWQNHEKL